MRSYAALGGDMSATLSYSASTASLADDTGATLGTGGS
jgi:hypothetical protein